VPDEAAKGPASGSLRRAPAALSTLVADRADALFVAPDSFFTGRFVQFVTLAAHHRIPEPNVILSKPVG
jgi:hypothetical protein